VLDEETQGLILLMARSLSFNVWEEDSKHVGRCFDGAGLLFANIDIPSRRWRTRSHDSMGLVVGERCCRFFASDGARAPTSSGSNAMRERRCVSGRNRLAWILLLLASMIASTSSTHIAREFLHEEEQLAACNKTDLGSSSHAFDAY
jgi:hypothetical protein